MALIETWANPTCVARWERQQQAVAMFSHIVDEPLNRAQRRAIAKSGRVTAIPSRKQIVKNAQKLGQEEALRRKVAFFGPKLCGLEREGRYMIRLGQRHRRGLNVDETESITRVLTPAEAHRVNKLYKKAKKKGRR